MIHPIGMLTSSAGGGGGVATITFNPDATNSNSTILVAISTTNCAKYRWKINAGAWTTVNATSGTVSVTAATLYADGLNASNNVLVSYQADYIHDPGGGG